MSAVFTLRNAQHIDGLVIPDAIPRRQWWYMLPERHWHYTKLDKSLIGKRVRIERFIVRTGYYFEHHDVESHEIKDILDELILRTLADVFNTKPEELPGLMGKRHLPLGKGDSYLLTRVDKYSDLRDTLVYKARKEWIKRVWKTGRFDEYRGLRTFFYVNVHDIDPDESRWVRISGVKSHQVGVYNPPSSYHYSGPDGDDYDYDPGGLGPGNYQQVYISSTYEPGANKPFRNYEDYYDSVFKIHPLDILEVEE